MDDDFRLKQLGRYTEATEAVQAALKARGEALHGLLRLLRPAAEVGPHGWPMLRLDRAAIDGAVLALAQADDALAAAVSAASHAAEIVRRPAPVWAR